MPEGRQLDESALRALIAAALSGKPTVRGSRSTSTPMSSGRLDLSDDRVGFSALGASGARTLVEADEGVYS